VHASAGGELHVSAGGELHVSAPRRSPARLIDHNLFAIGVGRVQPCRIQDIHTVLAGTLRTAEVYETADPGMCRVLDGSASGERAPSV
jgi:hypothetical protein